MDSTIIIVCSVSGVLILALTAALVVVYRWYRTGLNHPVHVVQPRFGSQYDYEDGYTTRQSCQRNIPKVFRIIRSFLVLKQPTSAFTLKNLGRHYGVCTNLVRTIAYRNIYRNFAPSTRSQRLLFERCVDLCILTVCA